MDAKTRRRTAREDARNYRDDYALRLYASGMRIGDIALELHEQFGTSVTSVSNVWEMVRRALARSETSVLTKEEARSRYLLHMEQLLAGWMPLALPGKDDDGNPRPPSKDAAELVLKVLDRYGVITGAITAQRPGDVNLTMNVVIPPDAEGKRRAIQGELAAEAARMLVVEGELSAAGTSLSDRQAGEPDQGQLPPPPGIIINEEE